MVEVVLATENMTEVIFKIHLTGLEYGPYIPIMGFRTAIRQGRILAAVEDNRILGFHWIIQRENDYWQGHKLCVHPQARGKGVGKALWVAVIEEADAVNAGLRLKVATNNKIAISLYQSLDFQIINLLPGDNPLYTMERHPRDQTTN
jgi:ribosomal protein S18 acetylase RimI-like enzyme